MSLRKFANYSAALLLVLGLLLLFSRTERSAFRGYTCEFGACGPRNISSPQSDHDCGNQPPFDPRRSPDCFCFRSASAEHC